MTLVQRFRDVLIFLGLMWGISILNWLLPDGILAYGIYPRQAAGLPGIVMSPFLHANLFHLLSNTVPILIIGSLVALEGKGRFWFVTLAIMLLGGILVWIFGRGAWHIGASGVVYGLFAYLLGRAWWQRDFRSIFIAIVVLILYSGFILGLFIPVPGVSFEGHLFGFLSGGIVAYISARRNGRRRKNI